MTKLPPPLRHNPPQVWPWLDADLPTPDPDWPRITVITPSFNQADYLEETLRSILAQGYPNLDAIVVDGGSTDGSLRILEHYGSCLSHWVSEADHGQADALNKGFALATGDLCNWINSDDLLTRGALHEIATCAKGADMVAGVTEDFDPDGRTRRLKTHGFTFAELVRQGAGGDVLWHQPSIWTRRQLLEQALPLSTDLHYKFDYELFLKVLAQSPTVAYTDRVLARFRLHDTSKTVSNQMGFLEDHVEVLRRMSAYGPAQPWAAQTRQALGDKAWALELARLTGDGTRSRLARLGALYRMVRDSEQPRCNASSRRAARRILLRGVHVKQARRPRRHRMPWRHD